MINNIIAISIIEFFLLLKTCKIMVAGSTNNIRCIFNRRIGPKNADIPEKLKKWTDIW
jgi:hypothetical protein